jgi:thiosulfate reductase/polysulfide reductase chain A
MAGGLRRQFIKISANLLAAAGMGVAAGPSRLPRPSRHERRVRTVPTFCDICFWKCGAIAHVRDGKLWKLEGNPLDPLCRGRLCPRGTGGVGAHRDPDRLTRPLLRAKVRGEEQWNAVSWDDALGFVAEKMQAIKAKHGPEAMALFCHGIGGTFLATMRPSRDNLTAPAAQCRGRASLTDLRRRSGLSTAH